MHVESKVFRVVFCWLMLQATAARAEKPAAEPKPVGDEKSSAQKVDLKEVQKKYWAAQESTDVEAVQHRLYSKSGKIQFGVFGGMLATDPFIDVKSAGATLGYHFSEYFSVNVLYVKHFSSPSSAETSFEKFNAHTATVNNPKDYKAAEVMFYPLYGKLSLLGKSIMYFDSFLLAGGGLAGTDNGDVGAFHFGLGAQLYLSKTFSLRLDYRLMNYTDHLIQTSGGTTTDSGPRNLWNGLTTVGFGAMF